MELSDYAIEIRQIINNNDNIKLEKFKEYEDHYIFNMKLKNKSGLKLTTDFDTYCFCESNDTQIDKINALFYENKKMDVKFIISKLLFSLNEQQDIDIVDKYHIYQKFDDFSKISIDYDLLEKESIQYQINNSSILSKVPKELLFNSKQIYNMIINEIKTFNKNTNFKHFIEPINNNPYCLKCFQNQNQ